MIAYLYRYMVENCRVYVAKLKDMREIAEIHPALCGILGCQSKKKKKAEKIKILLQ